AADPNIDIKFRTHACTGATTLNVFDARDPDGDSTEVLIAESNRPSPAVPRLHFRRDVHGNVFETVVPDGWESRQAASLAAVQAMAEADMITITIGGNDADFADVLRKCVLGGRDCGRRHLASEYDKITTRLQEVLTRLKRVAPDATIFVLGYPHITPEPIEANRVKIESCGLLGQPLHASGITAEPITAVFHTLLGGNVADAAISYSEAQFLWDTATDLNRKIRAAAILAGAHFVDVSGGLSSVQPSDGFIDHSPCSSVPWVNGFVRMSGLPSVSESSFHPNAAGHGAYARLLELFIQSQTDAGAILSDSGIPANPKSGV
ncbi:MAG: GDSL-type esterase/lipase family protein, partial [Gammaproteobacteria bacterium]|nr:GDSL-type esterase/lipase family protein [Gammaproteobacteria bacterium]